MIRTAVTDSNRPAPSSATPTVRVVADAADAPARRGRGARLDPAEWFGVAVIAFLAVVAVWAALGDGRSTRAAATPTRPPAPESPRVPETAPETFLDGAAARAVAEEMAAVLAMEHPAGADLAQDLPDVVAGPPPTDPSDVLAGRVLRPELADLVAVRVGETPWTSAAALSTYDPATDTIHVAASRADTALRSSLLRSLVLAIHWRAWDAEADDAPDLVGDAALARVGFAEGDAARIVEEYRRGLPGRHGVADERPGIASPAVGLFALVVEQGREFATGADLVDRDEGVLARPPATTEQLAHLDRYRFDERGLDVVAPAAQGEPVADGTLGELGLTAMLDAMAPEPGDERWRDLAEGAAEGWGGDAFVVWRDGGRLEGGIRFLMDSAVDRDELVDALRVWTRWHGRAAVTEEGRYVLVRFDGEPSRRVQPFPSFRSSEDRRRQLGE